MTTQPFIHSALLIVSLTVLHGARRADAQPAAAQAEHLFREGKRLVSEGNITAACEAFEGIYGEGIYEKNGKRAQIDMYLQGSRAQDDALANRRYGEAIGVPDFKPPQGYTWHHKRAHGKDAPGPHGHSQSVPSHRRRSTVACVDGNYDGYQKSIRKDDE